MCSTCWAGLPSGNGTRVPQAVRHLVSFSYFFHSCLWDITPYTGKQCPPHSCLPSPYLEIRSLQALPLTLRTWGGAVPALREAAQVCTGNVHSSLCQRQQTRKPPAPQNCPCCDEAHPEAAPPLRPDASDTGTAVIPFPSWPLSAANLDPPRPSICPSHHHRNRTPRLKSTSPSRPFFWPCKYVGRNSSLQAGGSDCWLRNQAKAPARVGLAAWVPEAVTKAGFK